MASIVKRGKSYSVVYYIGKKQLWESGLSYAAAKAFKAKVELDQSAKEKTDKSPASEKDRTVNEFLYELSLIHIYSFPRWSQNYTTKCIFFQLIIIASIYICNNFCCI